MLSQTLNHPYSKEQFPHYQWQSSSSPSMEPLGAASTDQSPSHPYSHDYKAQYSSTHNSPPTSANHPDHPNVSSLQTVQINDVGRRNVSRRQYTFRDVSWAIRGIWRHVRSNARRIHVRRSRRHHRRVLPLRSRSWEICFGDSSWIKWSMIQVDE